VFGFGGTGAAPQRTYGGFPKAPAFCWSESGTLGWGNKKPAVINGRGDVFEAGELDSPWAKGGNENAGGGAEGEGGEEETWDRKKSGERK